MDLDRFKEVNDSFGHPVGDDVLRALGPRLRAAMRAGDVLVRIGGDEFAAVLTDADSAYATVVAERLTAAIEQVVDLEVASLHVRASIGIALAPDHAITSTELLRCADVAMYRSKANRLPFDLYEFTLDDGRSRVRLLEKLRGAVDDGQLVLHYQPQPELRTGQLSAVEALVRWQHPELGLVPPADFLPLAEEAGLMRRLTDYVLDRAVGQATAWRRDGHLVRVSVNLSATNLQDAEIVDRIRFALARHRCRPEALSVEVTESSVMADRVHSEEVLQRLRAVGVHVSIDDFGTEFSSLSYLSSLAVDDLKIDRSFTERLSAGGDSRDEVIVRATIDLGHALGLQVVTEGVGDLPTLARLTECGSDLAQGFLVGEPVPPERVTFAASPLLGLQPTGALSPEVQAGVQS